MSSYSLSKELTGLAFQNRAALTLQDQVAQLFLETREDVYRYLLSLGLYPPQAQEGAQEVFLRLYATLRKGEKIQNPRAWIFRVAHNLGLKIRAQQHTGAPFDASLESQIADSSLNPEQSLLEREQADFRVFQVRCSEPGSSPLEVTGPRDPDAMHCHGPMVARRTRR